MRIILFLLVFIILNARENPFVPVITNENKNLIKQETFKETKILLPSDARILKSVTFTYQTLTGSILNKTIIINKAINWHSPIYISQQKIKNDVKKVKVGFLDFYIDKYKVLISSKDKMIRHFVLVEPFRVIFDFKANRNFLTYKKNINSFIKKVVVGNHDNFYRIVLYTDGVYKPIIKKVTEGYLIDFK
jgi:hypothetical protein